ncbi:transcriptional regulator [Chitinophaga oryziterrae]|uniref:Transcriptional regulator n=1 Tax=Chitinophaga oryziterrae TaxID=1031224 RepID=A0A6N8J818_9BACT|nr:helix-turn-helix domain-containing protein [Chitinophaga oryziterrae]MVT41084.1 transcriptional regulator [Chitinophaga oryziterrae]
METQHKSGCTFEETQASIMMPVFDSLDALRGRWRLPILISLFFGAKRFTEISKAVSGISDKVLARELKELELNQLITRTVHNSFPPTVVYSATPHGESVERLVIELKNWGEKHRQQVIGKSS